MKLKNILLIIIAILSMSIVNAQKVKLKKGKVILEKKEILKYEKSAMELSLYELNEDDEIIFIKWMDNETTNYIEDDFIKIHFIKLDLVCELSSGYGRKGIINKLLKEKVLSPNGKFNEEKAEKFVKKYDENITNRTFRN